MLHFFQGTCAALFLSQVLGLPGVNLEHLQNHNLSL